MSVDARPFAEVVDADRGGVDPPVSPPRLRRHPTACAEGAARHRPRDAGRGDRPRVRRVRRRRFRLRPDPPARRRALGQRIVVSGRVLDSDGTPLRGQLIEIWQANAAGRYRHAVDTHDAPLDPDFSGAGRCLTDDDGRYRFVTVKPGIYPWGNHPNAWRPAHIHFSLFGRAFSERLITQMYFPDDPLFPFDPIFASIRDERARARLVSTFDLALTEPDWALGFRWDIVLGAASDAPGGAAR